MSLHEVFCAGEVTNMYNGQNQGAKVAGFDLQLHPRCERNFTPKILYIRCRIGGDLKSPQQTVHRPYVLVVDV